MYVNGVTIVGNTTDKPRLFQGDGKVADFSVGMNKRSAGGDGEYKETTDFIDVECWGAMAEHVEASIEKGARVIVTGTLRQDRWTDPEGNARSRVKIRAATVGLSLEFNPCGTLTKEEA